MAEGDFRHKRAGRRPKGLGKRLPVFSSSIPSFITKTKSPIVIDGSIKVSVSPINAIVKIKDPTVIQPNVIITPIPICITLKSINPKIKEVKFIAKDVEDFRLKKAGRRPRRLGARKPISPTISVSCILSTVNPTIFGGGVTIKTTPINAIVKTIYTPEIEIPVEEVRGGRRRPRPYITYEDENIIRLIIKAKLNNVDGISFETKFQKMNYIYNKRNKKPTVKAEIIIE